MPSTTTATNSRVPPPQSHYAPSAMRNDTATMLNPNISNDNDFSGGCDDNNPAVRKLEYNTTHFYSTPLYDDYSLSAAKGIMGWTWGQLGGERRGGGGGGTALPAGARDAKPTHGGGEGMANDGVFSSANARWIIDAPSAGDGGGRMLLPFTISPPLPTSEATPRHHQPEPSTVASADVSSATSLAEAARSGDLLRRWGVAIGNSLGGWGSAATGDGEGGRGHDSLMMYVDPKHTSMAAFTSNNFPPTVSASEEVYSAWHHTHCGPSLDAFEKALREGRSDDECRTQWNLFEKCTDSFAGAL